MKLPILHVAIIDTYRELNKIPNPEGKIDTRSNPTEVSQLQLDFMKHYVIEKLKYHDMIHFHYGDQSDEHGDIFGAHTLEIANHLDIYNSVTIVEMHMLNGDVEEAIDASTDVICIMSLHGVNDNLFALNYAANKGKNIIKLHVDGSTTESLYALAKLNV